MMLSVKSVEVGGIDSEFHGSEVVLSRAEVGNMVITKIIDQDGSEALFVDSGCGEIVKISQGS